MPLLSKRVESPYLLGGNLPKRLRKHRRVEIKMWGGREACPYFLFSSCFLYVRLFKEEPRVDMGRLVLGHKEKSALEDSVAKLA